MLKKVSFLIIFSFLIIASTSWAYSDSVETRLNLWPVFVYSKVKGGPNTSIKILGPIFVYERTSKYKKFGIRPFLTQIDYPNKREGYFLSPFGRYETTPSQKFFGLAPILFSKERKDPFTGKVNEYHNFLIFFWGKDMAYGSYGGIFPIYGIFKNKFATKKITFFLWPIYTKVEYSNYNATNIFWPFIRIISSKNPYYHGFKIFPFYGNFRLGDTIKKFIFWPFYIREYSVSNQTNYFSKLIVFPFYAKQKTNYSEKTSWLWPFFQVLKKKDPYYEEIDAPWPFLVKIKGKEKHGIKIWPLYTYTRTPYSRDYCILWPLYCYSSDDIHLGNQTFKKTSIRFLVINKFEKEIRNKQYFSSKIKFWPFLYWNKYSKNDHILKELWFFPYIIPIKNRGVQENYCPFLRWIVVKRSPEAFHLNILWGLFDYDKTKNRRVTELAFLFRRVIDLTHHTNYFEFLQGLIGFGKVDGKRVCKLLFVNLCN